MNRARFQNYSNICFFAAGLAGFAAGVFAGGYISGKFECSSYVSAAAGATGGIAGGWLGICTEYYLSRGLERIIYGKPVEIGKVEREENKDKK